MLVHGGHDAMERAFGGSAAAGVEEVELLLVPALDSELPVL